MQLPKPALYAISDWELYLELEFLYREGRFLPGQAVAFLGSTFGDEEFWNKEYAQNLPPTSRLLLRWVPMNQRSEEQIIPALRSGKYVAVFIHGYGREAYHFAVRYRACPQTLNFHQCLVGLRVSDQGGIPPTAYLSRRPVLPYEIEADKEYFEDPRQRMFYLSAQSRGGMAAEATAFVTNDIQQQTERLAAAA